MTAHGLVIQMISKYENVPLLATGFSIFAVDEKLSALIKTRKNIFFDTSATALLGSDLCKMAKSNVPEEQICFGSLSPFNYIETNLLRIELADGVDTEKIKQNGIRAFRSVSCYMKSEGKCYE